MGSCKCGNKTVKFTPGRPKKKTITKGTIKGTGIAKASGGFVSPEIKKMQQAARKKALKKARANSGPCTCTQ